MATELLPGIWDLTSLQREQGRIRAFVVEEPEPILFDCGMPDTHEAVFAELDDAGVTPDHLVITHADGDHIGTFDAVVEQYGVTTHLPEGATPDIDHEPDHRYTAGHTVGSFVAVETLGHRTPHYTWVSEERSVAVMGDAANGSDYRGLPAGYFHLPPGWFSEDLIRAEQALADLLDYEFDAGLVYHGSSVLEGAREKLAAYVGPLRD